jgi:hypothetical protein
VNWDNPALDIWVEKIDEEGKKCWENKFNGKTTYSNPHVDQWEKKTSDKHQGRPYWQHKVTGECCH